MRRSRLPLRITLATTVAALLAVTVGPLQAAEPEYAGSTLPPHVAGAGKCAGKAPGGEWPLYGNTPDNARFQPLEDKIGPDNVGTVQPVWQFRPAEQGLDGGGFSSTPTVFGGCVYVTTTSGWVAALNADTGELVWRTGRFQGIGIENSANVISASPTVVGNTIYIEVNQTGEPYVAALDRATGKVLWTKVFETGKFSFTVPAPVFHKGMIFQGFSGMEFEKEHARGGYVVLDASRECSAKSATACANPVAGATGGKTLVHRYNIDDKDFARGYRGVGIWCTAAVDVKTDSLYACTSNPASHGMEHRYATSLLKIDMKKGSPTFGDIVASYKGKPDSYVDGLDRQPACDNAPDATPYYSATCVAFDLDFGASPNLFRDAEGNLLMGALQKAGVYHAVHADTMQKAWEMPIGAPCIFCNASSAATDGDGIYAVASPVAYLNRLERSGHRGWVLPTTGAFHYQSMSVANGVAYTVNGAGTLVGANTKTGLPVLNRSMAVDAVQPAAEINSNGVSIARNTLYATVSDRLIAYRLPG